MDGDIPQLTPGFCDQIASSTSPQDPVWSSLPIVQILQAKAVEINGRTLWRTPISDGTHVLQAIVSVLLNTLFENEHAGKGSIVRVQRFTMSPINGKRQVIPQTTSYPLYGL